MRLTKFNPETGLYEFHEVAKTQAEYNEQRKAVIQRLGEIEDKQEVITDTENKSNNSADMSNKQIEEIAREVCAICSSDGDCNSFLKSVICHSAYLEAEHLYNAGYRKASEVAREIFELIDCAFSPVLVYNGYTIKEYLAELKKKYTEMEKDK